MPSERDQIKQIKAETSSLARVRAELIYWHRRLLESSLKSSNQKKNNVISEYDGVLARGKHTYEDTLHKVKEELANLDQQYGLSELDWSHKQWMAYKPNTISEIPHLTRIGWITEQGKYGSIGMPALLPIIGFKNVLIKANGSGKVIARELIQSITLRLLATLPPGKLRLICIDPVGLGSTVAGFIKGLPDFITDGQAYYDHSHIEKSLSDLESHMAFVKQKYLGISFSSMEEYNKKAGQIEEPYRLLIISDFPARFSESASQRLISIATNGPSTGVYTLIMVDLDQTKMPYGFNLIDLERYSSIITCDDGQNIWQDKDFKDCILKPDSSPPTVQFEHIISLVHDSSLLESDVRIPFETIFYTQPSWESKSAYTGDGIKTPIGLFGAKEIQYLSFDDKLRNSALVIGKTGSGKSTLLHTIINGLAKSYPPDELELYLLDLKEVEFKDYATFNLLHARVVAINCEREFGMSVLRRLDNEIHLRMDSFRERNLTSLNDYRHKTGEVLPRIILIVDEFQELFSDEDKILASEAALILDRLIRQGRAFGINIILASQTLTGPYTISTSTINQIPIRIVLQCSDGDSRRALSDENDRARLLERPGEAIFNSTNGRLEGNNRFQVAWLSDDDREIELMNLSKQVKDYSELSLKPQIVFEGNSPANIEQNKELKEYLESASWPIRKRSQIAWLGEPIEIKPHTAIKFRTQSRSNLIILGQNEYEKFTTSMLTTAILSLATQQSPESACFFILNAGDLESEWYELPTIIKRSFPHDVFVHSRRRDILKSIDELWIEVNTRVDDQEEFNKKSIYLIIIGLHRIRDLRRDEYYHPRADDEKPIPPFIKLSAIFQEGPECNIHALIWCDTYRNLSRFLDRRSIEEFDMRVALQMSQEDSRNLINSEQANKLGPYKAIFFDEGHIGNLEKFRPYGPPRKDWLLEQGAKLSSRKKPNIESPT